MKLFAVVVISVALAHPAIAQDAGTDASTMTCAEFVAMDTAGRTNAMESIRGAAVAAAAAIKEGTGVETRANDPTVSSDATNGTNPETSDGNSTATANSGPTNADAAPATNPTAAGSEDMTETLLAACSSVPDMRVTDAMMQTEAGGGNEGDAGATESDANGG